MFYVLVIGGTFAATRLYLKRWFLGLDDAHIAFLRKAVGLTRTQERWLRKAGRA